MSVSALLISALMRTVIADGVAAGTNTPTHWSSTSPWMPAS